MLARRPGQRTGQTSVEHARAPALARPLARRPCAARAAAADSGTPGKNVVVIGQGWAGFGAAKHLSEQGYSVTLLEASPNPGGLSAGWRTAGGRAVEAGMKGFWYQYKNLFALLEELQLSPWPLTEFTNSGFWSPRGLVTEAPVFSQLPRLPTLLGQFVHTSRLSWSLPLTDRLSLLPFLLLFLDYCASEDRFEKYDKMSAYEVFKLCGVSKRAYEEFLKPTLLVGLFAPPEEISAAVMLETLYFYALAHQNDFDVCWPRGSIAETIFQPLIRHIESHGGTVLGNRLVTGLQTDESTGEVTSVTAIDRTTGLEVVYPSDAVVFAIGVGGMQKLVTACPALGERQEFRNVMNLKTIDVVATRIWLDRRITTRFPANVLSGFEPSAGGTYFNLTELQDEYRNEPGTVITADWYHANALLPLSDAAIVSRTMKHIGTCEPAFKDAKVVDSAVLRFKGAVTHFSPGSLPYRPTQTTSIPNVFIAGDWVKGVPHGANGLSQERAYVTGLVAANLVVDRLGVGRRAQLLDVEGDEPHIALGRQAVRQVRELAGALGVRSPLL